MNIIFSPAFNATRWALTPSNKAYSQVSQQMPPLNATHYQGVDTFQKHSQAPQASRSIWSPALHQ